MVRRGNSPEGGGFDDWSPDEVHESAEREAKKAAAKERLRQRNNAAKASRRQSPGPPLARMNSRSPSLYRDPTIQGPNGQQRLFTARQEPEAFETRGQRRARTERVPQPARKWNDIRATPESPGRGVSQQSVRETLGEQGVTTRGAKSRLRATYRSAVARAGGGMPKGQDFYEEEQANRFEDDAKFFGVPYNVSVAVNAIMSPKTSLATPRGYQTNREAAHLVMRHVISGKSGAPNTAGKGLRANAVKAAELVRQHLENGTHPLDAVDSTGKHLLSGPKVEEYYGSYMHPGHAPTDIQHSRILFGPKVRSELSKEELEKTYAVQEEYGKNSPEAGRMIPKTPAENLLGKSGVHEWASHVTAEVANEFGIHPAEFQSADWHEHKTQRGGRSAVAKEMQPLFAPRGKAKPKPPTSTQFKLFDTKEYEV